METTLERKQYIAGACGRICNQLLMLSLTKTTQVEDGCVEQILKEAAQLQKCLDHELIRMKAREGAITDLVAAAAEATEQISEDELEEFAVSRKPTEGLI